MNLLKAVSHRSYLVLTFRTRTSAPSRAIFVRRFARTETLTFLSGTGTFTIAYHLQEQGKRKFLRQKITGKNFPQFESTSNGRTDLSSTSSSSTISASSSLKLSLLKQKSPYLLKMNFLASCSCIVFGKKRATGLQ